MEVGGRRETERGEEESDEGRKWREITLGEREDGEGELMKEGRKEQGRDE